MSVKVLGIPFDANSTFMKGPSEAPDKIREVLNNGAANLSAETGLSLVEGKNWDDLGNLSFTDETAFDVIRKSIHKEVSAGNKLFSIGGDHSITYPIIDSYSKTYSDLTIIHFDAHPDLYDELDGNRLSHACPFARIMENGHAKRLIQFGIRTLNPHQREQAKRFGVEIHDMASTPVLPKLKLDGPVYLSFDLDALDPAYAPGVSHHEPGGLNVREVITFLQNLEANVVGADLVELNPKRDVQDMSAMVCAKLFKEIMALLVK